MNAIDLILVACVVAAAAAYLAWALLGRRSAPACHNTGGKLVPAQGGGGAGAGAGDVVIGASLQRGLDRARARSRAAGR